MSQIPINFERGEDDFYLCYVNKDGSLNTFNNEFLKVTPFESVIRRFYLVGYFQNKLISLSCFTTGLNKYGYNVKVLINQEQPNILDFKTNNVSYAFIDNFIGNAIPIDVLLTSVNNTESSCNLSFKIEIKQLQFAM